MSDTRRKYRQAPSISVSSNQKAAASGNPAESPQWSVRLATTEENIGHRIRATSWLFAFSNRERRSPTPDCSVSSLRTPWICRLATNWGPPGWFHCDRSVPASLPRLEPHRFATVRPADAQKTQSVYRRETIWAGTPPSVQKQVVASGFRPPYFSTSCRRNRHCKPPTLHHERNPLPWPRCRLDKA